MLCDVMIYIILSLKNFLLATHPVQKYNNLIGCQMKFSDVERIFPFSLVRLLLAALRGRKITPKSRMGRIEGKKLLKYDNIPKL